MRLREPHRAGMRDGWQWRWSPTFATSPFVRLFRAGGNATLVKGLLEMGAVCNKADATGATPLHYAAQEGRLKVVEYLVEAGANVNRTSAHNVTPIMHAQVGSFWDGFFLRVLVSVRVCGEFRTKRGLPIVAAFVLCCCDW